MYRNRDAAHICHICERMEYEDAEIGTSEFWICPECCAKIKDLITPNVSQGIEGIMKNHD